MPHLTDTNAQKGMLIKMNRYDDSPEFIENSKLLPPIKRIAAVHDISCLGRCALTVIIPVLSAMGLQVIPFPTALLSTHTGGFENMFFEDLTRHMEQISAHWKSIGTDFDAIYSGFLGSAEQIDTLLHFIKEFSKKNDGKKTFTAIDPVMGDDGEPYSTYDSALTDGMSRLCYGADLITPNLTEACFLTGEKYPSHSLNENEARSMGEQLLSRLRGEFGCRDTVITGINAISENGDRVILTVGKGDREESPFFHVTPLLSRSYPGTGDLFASVLLGKMLGGSSFESAAKSASDTVSYATSFSASYKTPIRDGLIIEPLIAKGIFS